MGGIYELKEFERDEEGERLDIQKRENEVKRRAARKKT